MDKINKTAERFREVRKQLGFTQQQMADRLVLKRNTIAKIEGGDTEPSARTLSMLEGLLNKSIRVSTTSPPRVSLSLHEDMAPYGDRPNCPTPESLHAYLDTVIDEAGGSPLVIHYVWAQMQIHLDLEQVRKLKEKT